MVDVKKICKKKGLRMTDQRNIIADVITEMSVHGHPDVNEIFLNAKSGMNFYDRSMLDNLAYLKKNKHEIPTHFKIDCENHRYHPTVFITTPWEDIYTVDDERLESFKDSIQIFEALKQVYKDANYNLIELPQANVKERIRFIINEI